MLDDTAICYPVADAEYDHLVNTVSALTGAPNADRPEATPKIAAPAPLPFPDCAVRPSKPHCAVDIAAPVTSAPVEAPQAAYDMAVGLDCFMFH